MPQCCTHLRVSRACTMPASKQKGRVNCANRALQWTLATSQLATTKIGRRSIACGYGGTMQCCNIYIQRPCFGPTRFLVGQVRYLWPFSRELTRKSVLQTTQMTRSGSLRYTTMPTNTLEQSTSSQSRSGLLSRHPTSRRRASWDQMAVTTIFLTDLWISVSNVDIYVHNARFVCPRRVIQHIHGRQIAQAKWSEALETLGDSNPFHGTSRSGPGCPNSDGGLKVCISELIVSQTQKE
jgi:hypothetical protein